jgi:caffeoyl-CoA O-methyltransferase
VPRLRPGGIILVDNTFWHGRMVIESVTDAPVQGIRDLNDHAVADNRVELGHAADRRRRDLARKN